MSITVRYPTGIVVTYNDAHFLTHGEGQWKLSDKDPSKGGRYVAFIQASAGVIVEFDRACKVETVTLDVAKAAQILAGDATELKKQPFGVLRDLKRLLAHFNAKTGGWH
jgi:hypothetical protein